MSENNQILVKILDLVKAACSKECMDHRSIKIQAAQIDFKKLGEANFKLLNSTLVPKDAVLKSAHDLNKYFLFEQAICILIPRKNTSLFTSELRFQIYSKNHHLHLIKSKVQDFYEQNKFKLSFASIQCHDVPFNKHSKDDKEAPKVIKISPLKNKVPPPRKSGFQRQVQISRRPLPPKVCKRTSQFSRRNPETKSYREVSDRKVIKPMDMQSQESRGSFGVRSNFTDKSHRLISFNSKPISKPNNISHNNTFKPRPTNNYPASSPNLRQLINESIMDMMRQQSNPFFKPLYGFHQAGYQQAPFETQSLGYQSSYLDRFETQQHNSRRLETQSLF